MHKTTNKVLFFFSLFLLFNLFSLPAFANNPPDSGHSNLSVSNQAPADGQSTINVTVTLQDGSGNPLSGDNVSFSDPNNSSAVLNPSSTTLNSSGQASFTITSTNAETDNISVDDTSSNITLDNLGQVTFTSVETPTPASCTDGAPGSTPQLTSAVANGSSQITLTFTNSTNPVTNYLLAYGLSSGQYIYGNPNVGGQGTTSYTVNSLAKGTTYYFAVKAVNGCTPGSFSNEVSANTTGGVVASTPAPTEATSDITPTDTPTDTPSPTPSKEKPKTSASSPSSFAGLSATKKVLVFILAFTFLGLVGFGYRQYLKDRKRTRRNTKKDQPENPF